jgi:hypothetical protein
MIKNDLLKNTNLLKPLEKIAHFLNSVASDGHFENGKYSNAVWYYVPSTIGYDSQNLICTMNRNSYTKENTSSLLTLESTPDFSWLDNLDSDIISYHNGDLLGDDNYNLLGYIPRNNQYYLKFLSDIDVEVFIKVPSIVLDNQGVATDIFESIIALPLTAGRSTYFFSASSIIDSSGLVLNLNSFKKGLHSFYGPTLLLKIPLNVTLTVIALSVSRNQLLVDFRNAYNDSNININDDIYYILRHLL